MKTNKFLFLAFFVIFIQLAAAEKTSLEIYAELEKSDDVQVIIKVKSESGFLRANNVEDIENSLSDENTRTYKNLISAEISREELNALKNNLMVERIEFAPTLHAFLQDTKNIVGASSTWNLQISDVNLTGQ